MLKRFCTALLLLSALAPTAGSQQVYSERRIPLMSERDNDSTAGYEYCVTTGLGSVADAPERPEDQLVTTSGSNTTVTALTASSGPFRFVSVGDELLFKRVSNSFADSTRYVATRTNENQITVNAAIDLSLGTSGKNFTWRKQACGTAATDGWIQTAGHSVLEVQVQLDQSDATSIDVELACETHGSASAPVQVFAKNYTSYSYPSNRDTISVDLSRYPFDRCRLGVKLATDASDAGGNLEKISAYARLIDLR